MAGWAPGEWRTHSAGDTGSEGVCSVHAGVGLMEQSLNMYLVNAIVSHGCCGPGLASAMPRRAAAAGGAQLYSIVG